MKYLTNRLARFKQWILSIVIGCCKHNKVIEWDDMPININTEADVVYQILPKNTKIDKNTKLEFHKHAVKDGMNVVETIEVEHEIISKKGWKILKIYNGSEYVSNNIDVHFFIETKNNNL